MRPQQQNRRMRGRNNNNNSNNNNNNNRKGPNPLTRNYESNGPDVKIRGSAHQIAEKYATLARDAQSSGDRVMAENYLQHAEHYNRIIAAAQAQMPQQFQQQSRNDDIDDDLDEDRDDFEPQAGGQYFDQQPQQPVQSAPNGSGPQPVIEGTPAEVALNPDAGQANGSRRERAFNGHQNEGEGEGGQGRRNRRPRRGAARGERFAEGGERQDGRPDEGQATAARENGVTEAPVASNAEFAPIES